MLDMMLIQETRAERRRQLAMNWNTAVAVAEFSWKERREADAFTIFAGEWSSERVHPDDMHWFCRTYPYGYPETDQWEPDVNDEEWPTNYREEGIIESWNPFERSPVSNN